MVSLRVISFTTLVLVFYRKHQFLEIIEHYMRILSLKQLFGANQKKKKGILEGIA
jgi:hypothetical protein